MKLTRYTDYALRVLMHVAARPERLSSIGEIARSYSISQNHLMKVVHDLRKSGFLAAVRGRSGGIRLARPASEIVIGQVVRHTEDGFDLVDCGACVLAPACGLTGILNEATTAFLKVLDGYTLADLVDSRMDALRAFFPAPKIPASAQPAQGVPSGEPLPSLSGSGSPSGVKSSDTELMQ